MPLDLAPLGHGAGAVGVGTAPRLPTAVGSALLRQGAVEARDGLRHHVHREAPDDIEADTIGGELELIYVFASLGLLVWTQDGVVGAVQAARAAY